MSEPLMNAEKLRQVTDAVRDAWNHWNTHEYRRDLLYDLLNDYTRLRTLPPEVAAAMRDYASEQDADGIEELAFIIADHFTTLFHPTPKVQP